MLILPEPGGCLSSGGYHRRDVAPDDEAGLNFDGRDFTTSRREHLMADGIAKTARMPRTSDK
jgi:hypothetical protein